jgi:hypothetical protein
MQGACSVITEIAPITGFAPTAHRKRFQTSF